MPTFECAATAKDLPPGLWDSTIAAGDPLRSQAFLECLEKTYPQRRFAYVTAKIDGQIVGLVVITAEPFDLVSFLPSPISGLVGRARRWLPNLLYLSLAMVGTMETGEGHWWVNRRVLTVQDFASGLVRAVFGVFPGARALVFRDFLEEDEDGAAICKELLDLGFHSVLNLPLARIAVNPGTTAQDHYSSLKRRARASVRDMKQALAANGLLISPEPFSESLLDELYPLFLAVHARATEFVRPPFPKDFFRNLAHTFPAEMLLVVVRQPQGRAVGFVLAVLNHSIANLFLLGMDYDVARTYRLYRGLIWHGMELAMERGCTKINLGVTSYFIKQDLGAKLLPMKIALRFQPPLLHRLLRPFINTIFDSPQPAVRSARDHSPARGSTPLIGTDQSSKRSDPEMYVSD